MKNRFVLCLLIVLCYPACPGLAQKIKGESIHAGVRRYPIVPLPESFKTYAVTAASSLNAQDFSKVVSPVEKVKLEAFTRVSGKADLNIKVSYGPARFSRGAKVYQSLDELKGLSATDLIEYTVPMVYEITDSKGIVVQREHLNPNGVFSITSDPSAFPKSVAVNYIVSAVNEYVNSGIDKIAARIADLFDIYTEKMSLELYGIKASKTETYDDFNNVVKKIDEAFAANAPNAAATQEAVLSGIKFWESKIATYNKSTEDDLPHLFLCAYDLAAAYWMLDDYDKAMGHLETASETKQKTGYLFMLRKQIEKYQRYRDDYLKEKALTEKDPTRLYQHFTETDKSPLAVLGLQKETAPASTYMEKGFIVSPKGDTLFGNFIEFDTNFKQTRILFLENGKSQVEYKRPWTGINRLSLRGKVYVPKDGSLIQAHYFSPKVAVFSSGTTVYFEFTQPKSTKEYSAYDPNDGASYVTNFNKKLAALFKEACPAVQQKALTGAYNLKTEGVGYLEDILKDYESNCGSAYETFSKWTASDVVKSKYK